MLFWACWRRMVLRQPMSAAPNVDADQRAPTPRLPHAHAVVVGIALGVAWLAMRPMLTGVGLAVVGFVAAVPIAWTWRRTRCEITDLPGSDTTMSVGSRPKLQSGTASSDRDVARHPNSTEVHP